MKLVSLKCPSCGAKLEVNESLKKFTCNYCDTTTMLDDESIVIKNVHSKLDNEMLELEELFENGNYKKSNEMAFSLLKKYPQNEDIRKIFVKSRKKLNEYTERNQLNGVMNNVKRLNGLFYKDIPTKELSTIPSLKYNKNLVASYLNEYPDNKEIKELYNKIDKALAKKIKSHNRSVVIITVSCIAVFSIIVIISVITEDRNKTNSNNTTHITTTTINK